MNRVPALLFRPRNESRDVQVRFHGAFPGADLIRLVRFEAVQPQAIFLRVDADRTESQLVGGTENANSDFTAVSSKQFLNVFSLRHQGSSRPRNRDSR